jgi:hypothetical protein
VESNSTHNADSACTDPTSAEVFRVQAVVEAEPGAVIRILQLFQARNLVPRRVSAQIIGAEYIQMDVEIAGLSHQVACQIVAKIRAVPSVFAAALWD